MEEKKILKVLVATHKIAKDNAKKKGMNLEGYINYIILKDTKNDK